MPESARYRIRSATLRDARALAEVQTSAWRAVCEALAGAAPSAVQSIEKRMAFWREAVEHAEPQVLVAIDKDRVVGFVAFDRSRDRGTPQTTGEIWAICALPTHWSSGIGRALWDAGRDGLIEEGCTKATLWLPVQNERAMRFFENVGFEREPSTVQKVEIAGLTLEEIRLVRRLV